MKQSAILTFPIAMLLFSATVCSAHFGMVIPSSNIISQENKTVELALSFSHPFETIGMDMQQPEKFYALKNGETTDLLPDLQQADIMDHNGWQTEQKIGRPGVLQYVMEPQPYWEPAEDIYIIHYTKTIVAAYGADSGWEKPAGLPTEIIPLTRPYGNYAGNSFTGKVLIDGSPAANAAVEVEFYNQQQNYTSPSDYHITQVVTTDERGIFTFTCPINGWWGFSALHEADYTMTGPDNEEKVVELGAVLWLYFDALKR